MLVILPLSGHSGLHGTLGVFPAATRQALLMSAHSSGQELRVLWPMGPPMGGLTHNLSCPA